MSPVPSCSGIDRDRLAALFLAEVMTDAAFAHRDALAQRLGLGSVSHRRGFPI